MNNFDKHAFVCINNRDPKLRKKSCGESGLLIRSLLIKELSNYDQDLSIRINKSGCLGKCAEGPIVVVYPEGRWYSNVKCSDITSIIEESILNDEG